MPTDSGVGQKNGQMKNRGTNSAGKTEKQQREVVRDNAGSLGSITAIMSEQRGTEKGCLWKEKKE